MSASLPVEVWSHILKQIPKPNQPQLLSVCSLFHDILLSSLFSSIKIYFIGSMKGTMMLNTFNDEWIQEIAGKLMTKSWELLNHICEEPRFARAVKQITVVAFGDGLALFERMTVANALLFVPNLQTFRWIGCGPQFSPTVAECLPSTLRKLVVQSSFPSLQSLQHLNSLESLHLSTPWFFPDDEETHDGWTWDDELMELLVRQPAIETIFETLTSHLQSLRITASHVRGIPIRILNNLLDLEIVWVLGGEDESVGLDLVFHHANLLQSLTMVGYIMPGLFAYLPSFSSLPHLMSFRMSCEPSTPFLEDGHVDLLCHFLQNRQRLRRLYLRLPLISFSETHDLWSTVERLSGLEVLGLHAGGVNLQEHHFRVLLSKLPPKLKALHLAFYCETSSLLLLVDVIAKLQHLTFLHLYGTLSRLPILLEDLATEGKGLRMIGLNRALWHIERVGTNIVTNKWPRWKIKFCTEDDFLCEDDAWLFKYN